MSCGALLAVGAAPAAAKVSHQPEGSFNGSETPGGSLGFLLAISVDNSGGPSAGDVYVGGFSFSSGGYVYKFEEDGHYAGVNLKGSETPNGSFSFLNFGNFAISRGLAVDDSAGANAGDVYVADVEHNVVDRFSESGTFLCEITGKEYSALSTAEQEHECAGSAGSKTPQNGFGSAGGVAVNPVNGDVYVADTANAVIDEFNEAGEYLGQISGSHLSTPTSLAFNSTGELYVANATVSAGGNVVKFDAAGSFAGELDSGPAMYVAVNTSNDSVLVANGTALSTADETAEYDSSGTLVSTFGKEQSGAIGVSASTGKIYLGPLFAETVYMYGPAIIIPDTTATTATEVEQFSATLNGEVSPAGGGEVESCNFEYVTQAHFEAEGFEAAEEAPCSPATPYASATSVSAGVAGLQADTTYHFRVAASNSNAIVSYSAGETFTTLPVAVTGQATNKTASSATLNGTVSRDGATITECRFEYGTSTSYGEEAPCAESPAEIEAGTEPVPVHADVTGLTENSSYHFRLAVSYTGGSDAGADETFTTPSRPLIDTAYTSNLTASSVDLNAEINPMGFDTTYRFEWGTSESYGNATPEEDIGSETSDLLVSQHVGGLSAGTLYHWRVVATNAIGTATGKDHTFIYEPNGPSGAGCPNSQLRLNFSSALPDCRAYEQVSPVNKNNADVKTTFDATTVQQASVDGNGIVYEVHGSYPESPSGIADTQYLSSRGASGWSTQAIGLSQSLSLYPGQGFRHTDYELPFSPDLSAGVLMHAEPALVVGAPAGVWNLYVGRPATGTYQLVTNVTPPNQSGGTPQTSQFGAVFRGASEDMSHVIFDANDALTPEAPWPNSENQNLYEWVNGQLRLVGLIPSSGTSCTGAECVPSDGSVAGGQTEGSEEYHYSLSHAISADGSRIVFSTGSVFNGGRHIYDRLNGTTTVDVSASQRTTPEPGTPDAAYQDASVDGSQVLFTSEGALTNDAVPGSGANLYDYHVESGQLTDLTAANDVRVKGFVGLSEDASYVYFVAEGVLAANSNSHGDTAIAGEPNLYLWHGGQTTFVATLDSEVLDYQNPADLRVWTHDSAQEARVTPDGLHLAFDSRGRLTGYNNSPSEPNDCTIPDQVHHIGDVISVPCIEVYTYDASANQLRCASCNPSGARPVGDSELGKANSERLAPRNFSADGSRLFFTSGDALVLGDTNGVSDVYEWEADGTGSCHSSADNGGCLYAISNGHAASSSFFADSTPSGNDVFFATTARLVGSDQGENGDLYDARVGGGFPEPPPPAPCEGESCRGEGTHAPAAPGAGTAAFQGPGNPAPKHCRKGFILRHGRCVKKKHHKKHRRRHHHRASAKTGAGK